MKPYGRREKIRHNLHNERCRVCYGDIEGKSVKKARARRRARAITEEQLAEAREAS